MPWERCLAFENSVSDPDRANLHLSGVWAVVILGVGASLTNFT